MVVFNFLYYHGILCCFFVCWFCYIVYVITLDKAAYILLNIL